MEEEQQLPHLEPDEVNNVGAAVAMVPEEEEEENLSDNEEEEYLSDDEHEAEQHQDEFQNIALMRQRFQANSNFKTFANLIGAFLGNIHSYRSKLFKQIWDTVAAGLDNLPHENNEQVEYVFYQLLDLLETTADPHSAYREDIPPRGFILVVIEEARETLGPRHIITYKLKLLLLFLSNDVAEECQELLDEDGSLDDLRQMFGEEGVKGPAIGSIYDTNIEEDPIRSMHYDLALGRVFKEAGALEEASNALTRGLGVAGTIVAAGGSPEWRGSVWLEDLTLCGSDILRAQAGITLMLEKPTEALEYLKKDRVLQLAWAAEDGNPSTENVSYVAYLTTVHQEGFDIHQLERLLQVHEIPVQFLDGVSVFIRANSIVLFDAGETAQSMALLEMSIIYFAGRYENTANVFRTMVLEEKYQLLLQRYKLEALAMADKPANLLQIHIRFIHAVDVEDYIPGPEFDLIMRKMLLLASAPSTNDQILAFARNKALELLEENPEDQAIAYEASKVFTEISFREARNGCGSVGSFLRKSFATYVKQVKAGIKGGYDPRFHVIVNLVLNKLRDEDTDESLTKAKWISRDKTLVLALLDVNQQQQEPRGIGDGNGDIVSLKDLAWSKVPDILDIWLQSVEILLDNTESACQIVTPADIMHATGL